MVAVGDDEDDDEDDVEDDEDEDEDVEDDDEDEDDDGEVGSGNVVGTGSVIPAAAACSSSDWLGGEPETWVRRPARP